MPTELLKRLRITRTNSLALILLMLLPFGWYLTSASADSQFRPSAPTSGQHQSDDAESTRTNRVESSAPRQPKDPMSYGLWVLLPAGVAILMAIFTRQVIPALIVGVLTGGYMLLPCLSNADPYAQGNAIVAANHAHHKSDHECEDHDLQVTMTVFG